MGPSSLPRELRSYHGTRAMGDTPPRGAKMRNKANFVRFWAGNEDRAKKQSQFPGRQRTEGGRQSTEAGGRGTLYEARATGHGRRIMSNKANFVRFWPENEGQAEKQSQLGPAGGDGGPFGGRTPSVAGDRKHECHFTFGVFETRPSGSGPRRPPDTGRSRSGRTIYLRHRGNPRPPRSPEPPRQTGPRRW